MSAQEKTEVTISVPEVSGEEVAAATDLTEHLIEKYQIGAADADALFNAMVAIFIRSRLIYGDSQPSMCSFANLLNKESEPSKN